jgi:hypothetical protein
VLFAAAIETMRADYWKISSPAAINGYHCRRFHRVTLRATVSTNNNRKSMMSKSYSLPIEPEGMVATLLERF